MSKALKIIAQGLIIAGALGWIVTPVVVFDRTRAVNKLGAVHAALTRSLVERRTLSEELDRLTARQDFKAGGATNYVTVKRAKLRLAPSTESQELAVLSPEISIEVLGVEPDGQWFEVGQVGYVFHELLRPTP